MARDPPFCNPLFFGENNGRRVIGCRAGRKKLPTRHMIVSMRFSLLLFMVSSALAQDAGATRADWVHNGGTQFSWRYSALDQVNTRNVKSLTPAWIFQTGDYAENLQTTPIVESGVMYLITARARVFALDAATGREIGITVTRSRRRVCRDLWGTEGSR